MYTKIDLKRNISFTVGGKEITVTVKEALSLASAIYDTLLSERIRDELALRGLRSPSCEEDERGCIAFDEHETELAMECPPLGELVQREAEKVVEAHHPKGEGRRP